jgi:multidrug transporter EmrE-like cation transporter
MSSPDVKLSLVQPFGANTAFAIFTNPFVAGGLFLYGIGALFWLGVLANWEVSKAYPMVGLGFALSVAIGFMLGEIVTTPRLIGVALICAGVILIGQS